METTSIRENQHLLVDLDTLLDTRMGTLVRLDLDNMLKMDKQAYLGRKVDKFSELIDIDDKVYNNMYAARDVETLKCSSMTTYMLAINDMLREIAREKIDGPVVKSIELHVNIFPYRLDDSVKEDIRDAVDFYANEHVEVRIVSMHPMIITPDLLKKKYALYATYDLDLWLGLQGKALETTPIPTVTVNVPSLYIDKIPDKDTIELLELKGPEQVFSSFEYLLSPFVTLTFTDVKFFCML